MIEKVKRLVKFSFSLVLVFSCMSFLQFNTVTTKAIDLCFEAEERLISSEGVYTINDAKDMYDLSCLLQEGHYLLVEDSILLKPEVSNLENAVSYTEVDPQQAILTKLVLTVLENYDPDEETLVKNYLAMLDKQYDKLFFIDVALYKIVGETQNRVNTANEKLMITFVLPLEYREQPFIFMHIHDGVVKPIMYEYSAEALEVSFESQEFSSHVLAAEQQPIDDPEDEAMIVNTSDDPNYIPWVLLGAGAIVVGFSLIKRKPKKDNKEEK